MSLCRWSLFREAEEQDLRFPHSSWSKYTLSMHSRAHTWSCPSPSVSEAPFRLPSAGPPFLTLVVQRGYRARAMQKIFQSLALFVGSFMEAHEARHK